jgi:hypothetical protein
MNTFSQYGSLSRELHKPGTFRYELLDFIAKELPLWRDRPDRPNLLSETALTWQLCLHLNNVAHKTPGWDILQFSVEAPDEGGRSRKIDLVATPSSSSIYIEGRKHSDFEILMPIECKRLPTPKKKNRDEREYVTSRFSSAGGIQRFKAGDHAAAHEMGAIIGYVQQETNAIWTERISSWISDLATIDPHWTLEDTLHLEHKDVHLGTAIFRSVHTRQNGLAKIELRHLWMEMN